MDGLYNLHKFVGMNLFRVLAKIFLIYLAYKVVVDFIIPTFRSVGQLKGQMKNMQERMDAQSGDRSTGTSASSSQKQSAPENVGEYIEFEEVKNTD